MLDQSTDIVGATAFEPDTQLVRRRPRRIPLRRTGLALTYIAAITVTWNQFRVGSETSGISWPDVALTIAVGLTTVQARFKIKPGTDGRLPLQALGFISLGALISGLVNFDSSAIVPLVLVISALFPLLAVWNHSHIHGSGALTSLARAFIVGTTVSSLFLLFIEVPIFGRKMGLSDHTNTGAFALSIGAAIALWLAANNPRPSRASIYWIIGALNAVGAAGTGSRTAALFLGMFLAYSLLKKLVPLKLVFGAAVTLGPFLAGFALSLPAVDRLLRGSEDTYVEVSNEGRRERLTETIELVERNPLFGSGFESARIAHSFIPGIWAGAGLVGLAGAMILYLWLIRHTVTGFMSSPRLGAVSLLSFTLLLYLTLQTNVDDRFLWYAIGLIGALYRFTITDERSFEKT